MRVQLFYLSKNFKLTDRTRLKHFVHAIFTKHKKDLGNLNYIFCSDEYLLGINKQHLKHNFYTDIITFDLSESKITVNGEIYISVDRVKDNAEVLSVAFKEELHRVVFHGALHLCGFKDKSSSDIRRMRRAEDLLLRQYFN
jgi:probable rRNA maturation factor